MVYQYYCVDCGHKLAGHEISFDLFEILEISNVSARNKYTKISSKKIIEWIQNGTSRRIESKKKYTVTLSLYQFMEILKENMGIPSKAESDKYSDDELEGLLNKMYKTEEMGNLESVEKRIEECYSEIRGMFGINDKNANKILLNDCKTTFGVELDLLDDNLSVYTLAYAKDPSLLNYHGIQSYEIRGYCPKCGKPVLNGTGKYPHHLIGLLGGHSAGKTSLIVSLVDWMLLNWDTLEMGDPGVSPLVDSRKEKMEKNLELYRKGWAVEKTGVMEEMAFNTSLLLQNKQGQKQVVTFADIAGESCWDEEKKHLREDALQNFPLINRCHLYLLCSCIDQTAYNSADAKLATKINPAALRQIATDIYKRRSAESESVAPMCIIATKTDVMGSPSKMKGTVTDNPIESMIPHGRTAVFEYQEQLTILKETYENYDDANIRIPLKEVKKTFDAFKEDTYLMVMSCSALGRQGKLYNPVSMTSNQRDEDMDEEVRSRVTDNEDEAFYSDDYPLTANEIPVYRDHNGKEVLFSPKRVDILWNWILEVLGLHSIQKSSYFLEIPSFGKVPQSELPFEEYEKELQEKKSVFINWSKIDKKINTILKDDISVLELMKGNTRKKQMKTALWNDKN